MKMPHRFFLSLFVCLIAVQPFLFAGENIQMENGASGYLALPSDQGAKSRPAIILVQEWWGLNDQIRGLADQFADNGFVALAVDLYRGKATKDPSEAHELMRGLPDDRALSDLKAAVSYLQSRPEVDGQKIEEINGKKIGVVGWCMGGGFALELALNDPRIHAVNMYYGKLVTDEKKLMQLKAPLLGFFGELDRGISPESVKEFEFKLNQLGKRVEIHIYPNAGHAFANPNNAEGYRPDAAKDAWQRTLLFFKSNLA